MLNQSPRLTISATILASCCTIPAHAQQPEPPVTKVSASSDTLVTDTLVTDTLVTDTLAASFLTPPDRTKPRTYWYWIDGRVSKQGITRDLENMKNIGIGEAYIGILGGEAGNTGPGGILALSEEWWGMIEHAIREGGRLGVDIGIFNGPGWSQSGGPWVKREQSQRHLVVSEMRLTGPQKFEGTLAPPQGMLTGQDVVAIAFPVPEADTDNIAAHNPKISGASQLFDGNPATSAAPPGMNGQHVITLEVEKPFTARSLVFQPVREIVSNGELQVSDDGVTYRKVCDYTIDRHYLSPNLGPEGLAPISLAFAPATGRFFRLTFSNADPLGEIVLSGAVRIEHFSEKHLGKMFQGPQPPEGYYDWASQAELDKPSLAIAEAQVKNLSPNLRGDHFTWDVPAGDWIVQRIGMASTGAGNHPAPPGARGLEIDKLNRVPLRAHFDGYIGQLLKRMPAADRKALKHVIIDSYETGSQNWTDGMAPAFQKRFGYDPFIYLPTLGGRVVGSVDQSTRFLWDLRRFVADRVSTEYIGGLSDISREHGLKLWSENYGHGGFFGEFLNYGAHTDEISGEFWEQATPSQHELRDASSAGHIYGKNVIFAEAWTGGPPFTSTPWSLKKNGDWAFSHGINQMVFHVNIGQPDDVRPGISAWFGTEFNRNNTWFPQSRSWIQYLQRCHYLLQQGHNVADVAYFIGEDVPKTNGVQSPKLPRGYNFDYINADVILNRLEVKNRRFVLPDGQSYKLLVLPPKTSMRPEVLAKLQTLVQQGAAILGEPPTHSPSLQNFPHEDGRLRIMANAMWGIGRMKVASTSKGRVFRGDDLQSALNQLNTAPDFSGAESVLPHEVLFTHRRSADADVYFLTNQSENTLSFTPSFRVANKAPELFDPVTGKTTALAVYDSPSGRTRFPLTLTPRQSVFVVLRNPATAGRVLNLTKDGQPLLSTQSTQAALVPTVKETLGTFTVGLWAKPGAETPLPKEAASGFQELYTRRNDVIGAVQGDTFGLGAGYAGLGLAVGTNGVAVYEHGAEHFAPVLVHEAPIRDWTHIAVAYEAGVPKLFINGKLVHIGLKSKFKVRPGEPQASFNGRLVGFHRSLRTLDAAEITKWMKSTLPDESGSQNTEPLELSQRGGSIEATVWQPGLYKLQTATLGTKSFNVSATAPKQTLRGEWQVAFSSSSGAPATLALPELISLSKHADPTVQYFSGTATYSKTFQFPALASNQRVMLDLGNVGSMAELTLNGQDLGTLWAAPYKVEVSKALKTGTNRLQVRVTNAWHNRLVGEKRSPESFKGGEKIWTSSMPDYGPNEPLFDAGLIGPVTLKSGVVVKVK